jgi:hypothetical protein
VKGSSGQPVFQGEYARLELSSLAASRLFQVTPRKAEGQDPVRKMDKEAPKSWSQFRGLPRAVSHLGKEGLIQSPTGVRCRKPIAVAKGLTGDSPSLFGEFQIDESLSGFDCVLLATLIANIMPVLIALYPNVVLVFC